MKATILVALTLVACDQPTTHIPSTPHFARTFTVSRFQRGNLHAHSLASDGDAPPETVIGWYKAHGYAFVALTDHNVFGDPKRYGSLVSDAFTVISGEEISMWVSGKQVHVNALCTDHAIEGGEFESAALAISTAVGAVRAQGGVAIVNHPNFDWALGSSDVLAVGGQSQLIEIASGHPYVHSSGDASHPSHEELWQAALDAGFDMMGVAVDDVHHVRASADPPAYPGVAWVEVFGDAPRPSDVCAALNRGDLYASTGPAIRRLRVTERDYEIDASDADAIEFIGGGGRALARVGHPRATGRYTIRGDESYVRARIVRGATVAWTPAVRVVAQ